MDLALDPAKELQNFADLARETLSIRFGVI